MNQDEHNLNLLAIFHYILGAIIALGSLIFIIYIGIGIAMLNGSFDGNNPPPLGFGWIFVIMGSLAMIFGWALGILMFISAGKLKKHESRTFCLVIAGIECLMMPLGTVLGVFTIVTLTKESVIRLFETTPHGIDGSV